MSATEKRLTIPQVAHWIGVRYATARDLLLRGVIPSSYHRGRLTALEKDVQAYRDRQQKPDAAA
jgi:hypothetical protein